MANYYHVAQNIEALMKCRPESWPQRFLIDGRRPTLREVQRAVVLALNKGFKVLPPCDNVDDNGMCKGHEEEA